MPRKTTRKNIRNNTQKNNLKFIKKLQRKPKTRKTRKTRKNKKVKKKIGGNKSNSCPVIKHCSPHISDDNKNNNKCPCSCFSRKSLLKIAKAWNTDLVNNYNSNKNTTPIKIYTNIPNGKLKQEINIRLKDKCKDEWCWIQQNFVKNINDDIINEETFKPIMPDKWYQNDRTWLNTLDIENVLSQYELQYPDFMFIGPVPIDFDKVLTFGKCVADELCKIDLSKLYKNNGIKRIGIVFNLDAHNQPGSHWVALFCDLNRKGLYYWDSYAYPAPNEVKKLMKRLKEQGTNMGIGMELKENKVRHQYKSSECGVYCIHFITQLLKGKTFNQIVNNKIPDDIMNKMRYKFFIKDNNKKVRK